MLAPSGAMFLFATNFRRNALCSRKGDAKILKRQSRCEFCNIAKTGGAQGDFEWALIESALKKGDCKWN